VNSSAKKQTDKQYDNELKKQNMGTCVHIWLDVKSDTIISAGSLTRSRLSLESVWKSSSNKHHFKLGMTDYVVTSNYPVDMDTANLFAIAHANGRFIKHDTGDWD